MSALGGTPLVHGRGKELYERDEGGMVMPVQSILPKNGTRKRETSMLLLLPYSLY
jgi:hypothetical protein